MVNWPLPTQYPNPRWHEFSPQGKDGRFTEEQLKLIRSNDVPGKINICTELFINEQHRRKREELGLDQDSDSEVPPPRSPCLSPRARRFHEFVQSFTPTPKIKRARKSPNLWRFKAPDEDWSSPTPMSTDGFDTLTDSGSASASDLEPSVSHTADVGDADVDEPMPIAPSPTFVEKLRSYQYGSPQLGRAKIKLHSPSAVMSAPSSTSIAIASPYFARRSAHGMQDVASNSSAVGAQLGDDDFFSLPHTQDSDGSRVKALRASSGVNPELSPTKHALTSQRAAPSRDVASPFFPRCMQSTAQTTKRSTYQHPLPPETDLSGDEGDSESEHPTAASDSRRSPKAFSRKITPKPHAFASPVPTSYTDEMPLSQMRSFPSGEHRDPFRAQFPSVTRKPGCRKGSEQTLDGAGFYMIDPVNSVPPRRQKLVISAKAKGKRKAAPPSSDIDSHISDRSVLTHNFTGVCKRKRASTPNGDPATPPQLRKVGLCLDPQHRSNPTMGQPSTLKRLVSSSSEVDPTLISKKGGELSPLLKSVDVNLPIVVSPYFVSQTQPLQRTPSRTKATMAAYDEEIHGYASASKQEPSIDPSLCSTRRQLMIHPGELNVHYQPPIPAYDNKQYFSRATPHDVDGDRNIGCAPSPVIKNPLFHMMLTDAEGQGASPKARRIRKRKASSIPELDTASPPPSKRPRTTLDPQPHPDLARFPELAEQWWDLKPVMIQEEFSDDPWKLLVATVFLNKTSGRNAIPTFRKVIERWPTPEDLMHADTDELVSMIQKLGLQYTRAIRLKEFSRAYHDHPPRTGKLQLKHEKSARAPFHSRDKYPGPPPYGSEGGCVSGADLRPNPKTPVSHLPGVGRYGWDSYRIFCTDSITGTGSSEEWKRVQPNDKELCRYLTWRWAYEEGRMWGCDVGPCGPVGEEWLAFQIKEELPRKS